MAANGDNQTVSEYIVHHLTNLTYGKLPEGFEREDGTVVSAGGQWTLAHGPTEMSAMGFNAVHVDSLAVVCWLGAPFLVALSFVGSRFASVARHPLRDWMNFMSRWWLSLSMATKSKTRSTAATTFGCASGPDDFCLGVFNEPDGSNTGRRRAGVDGFSRY